MSSVQFPTARGSRGGARRSYTEPKHQTSTTGRIEEFGIYYREYVAVSYTGKALPDKSLSAAQGLRRSLLRATPKDAPLKFQRSRKQFARLEETADFSSSTQIDAPYEVSVFDGEDFSL